MVVNPEDIIKRYSRDELKAMEMLELKIDHYLTENYQGGIVNFPKDNNCERLGDFKLDRFLDRYRKAEWTHVNIAGEKIEFGYAYSKIEGSFYDSSEKKMDNILELKVMKFK